MVVGIDTIFMHPTTCLLHHSVLSVVFRSWQTTVRSESAKGAGGACPDTKRHR
jgi:hypothetical protein